MRETFRNRRHAGQLLAARLASYAQVPHLLVLALPRGGVPVAFEVALALAAPLDVWLVRKLGVPGYRELAMGAIASGGVRVFNPEVLEHLQISAEILEQSIVDEEHELLRRESLYRGSAPPPLIEGKTVILIDDGVATGATVRAAIQSIRSCRPHRLVFATPTIAASACELLRPQLDHLVALLTPDPFYSVGAWYEDFSQTSDAEVRSLLSAARSHPNLRSSKPVVSART